MHRWCGYNGNSGVTEEKLDWRPEQNSRETGSTEEVTASTHGTAETINTHDTAKTIKTHGKPRNTITDGGSNATKSKGISGFAGSYLER